jgi:transposase
MLTLEEIISCSKDSREVKRALSVKMLNKGFKVLEIEGILQVSDSFISKWKLIYQRSPRASPPVQREKNYLDQESRKKVVSIIQSKQAFSVEELRDYLENEYQVVYKSKQSYYELLKDGGFSWKKTEKVNPKRDESLVEQRENSKNVSRTT